MVATYCTMESTYCGSSISSIVPPKRRLDENASPLNEYLLKYSSRRNKINWNAVGKFIQSNPEDVNELTLFYAVMVGSENKKDQLDFARSDDSNPIPLSIIKEILHLRRIEVNQFHAVLLYALMNNSVTTDAFQHIAFAYRRHCPKESLISRDLQSYALQSQREWTQCRTSPRRKLWLLW